MDTPGHIKIICVKCNKLMKEWRCVKDVRETLNDTCVQCLIEYHENEIDKLKNKGL